MAARERRRTERGDGRAPASRSRNIVVSLALGVGRSLASLGVFGCTEGPALEEGRARDALRVCPGPETVPGVDVSYYQGAVDWPVVAASGIRFAIARISDGTDHPDGRFAANWVAMQGAGLVRGAYQYFEPSEDPLLQAELVVEQVGRLGLGDLPVALDVEVSGGAPHAVIVSRIASWMDRVAEGTGKAPLVYTAKYFWDGQIGSIAFADRPLWVAQYGTECPDLAAPWNEWVFWQYSGQGSVAGIRTPVDLDRFNGSVDDLRRFANAPEAAPRDASQSERNDAAPTDAAVPADAALPRPSDSGRSDDSGPRSDPAPRDDAASPLRSAATPLPGAPHPATTVPSSSIEADGAVVAVRATDVPAPQHGPGCGCRAAAPRRPSPLWVLLSVWLLAFVARRHREEPPM